MRKLTFTEMDCAIATALEAVGDKWTLLIVRDLMLGLTRYEDLRRSTQIATTTLAVRLKQMQTDGLIDRVRYQSNPPRFRYLLTEKGAALRTIVLAMSDWAERYAGATAGVQLLDAAGQPQTVAIAARSTPREAEPLQWSQTAQADAQMAWRFRVAADDATAP